MEHSKKTESETKEKSGRSGFSFPCGHFEKMAQMMGKFCGGEKGAFSCEAMMKKMCCGPKERSGQK